MALARDKAQEECVLLQGRMDEALSGAAQALQQLQVSKFLLQVCVRGGGGQRCGGFLWERCSQGPTIGSNMQCTATLQVTLCSKRCPSIVPV